MNYSVKFIGGPMDGQQQRIDGQLPFRQFLIDGNMEKPIWHSYALNGEQDVEKPIWHSYVLDGGQEDVPIEMLYEGTVDFFKMAEIVKLFQKDGYG